MEGQPTGRAALGVMPTRETLVMERFFDEVGDMHVVIHSPFGARVHSPWSQAIEVALQQRLESAGIGIGELSGRAHQRRGHAIDGHRQVGLGEQAMHQLDPLGHARRALPARDLQGLELARTIALADAQIEEGPRGVLVKAAEALDRAVAPER